MSGFGLWLLVRQGFRCQSTPGPPYAVPSLFEIGILITEFSESWIRGLWLTAFGKAGFFRCQSGIRRLWLGGVGKAGLFGCQSGIRRLWLGGLSKAGAFWVPKRD